MSGGDCILAAFIAAAVLEVSAAVAVFAFRDTLHSIIAITAIFALNSVVFLILQLPLLAVLQLLIMVGGVATYLFIGAASASFSKFSHTCAYALGMLSVTIFALLAYPLLSTTFTEQSNLFGQAQISMLVSNYPMLYLLAFSAFGIAMGSIIILKRLRSRR